MTRSGGGSADIWEVATGKELCRLINFKDGRWVVVAPDGRFDSSDLEQISGLSWVMPDAPFKPLPLTIFERQYYEPRLLARVLAGEKLPVLPGVANVNRVQPTVTIESIAPGSNSPSVVSVTVKFAAGTGTVLQNGKPLTLTSASQRVNGQWAPGKSSGVFDLRLFRNGQLVGYRDGEVNVGPGGTAMVTFANIRLPGNADGKNITFTAYAFNADRVRSEIGRKEFVAEPPATPANGRAYIISMGVNASQAPGLSLRYAVNDAQRTAQTVAATLKNSGNYGAPIPIELIAPTGADAASITAHKDDFRVVLERLAGHTLTSTDAARLARIPNSHALETATPDDLVLISFSGHGEAGLASNLSEYGRFYFLPYDIGADFDASPSDLKRRSAALARCISSDELSLWLRDVDAGQMALIVDACHSAATVQAGDFKPGPMGSRGLGQLAYDKGMRVLAASQADNVALENEKLQQGLLSYALDQDGLSTNGADWQPKDGKITLAEWLAFGADDVPKVYERIRTGAIQPRSIVAGRAPGAPTPGRKGVLEPMDEVTSTRTDLQQPQLFDFNRYQPDPIIGKTVAPGGN